MCYAPFLKKGFWIFHNLYQPIFPFFLGLFFNGRLVIDHSSSTVNAESNNPAAILMDPVVDIVCYGIGRIASCPIARYQFAFLLLLREILQVNYVYHSKFNWHLEMNE